MCVCVSIDLTLNTLAATMVTLSFLLINRNVEQSRLHLQSFSEVNQEESSILGNRYLFTCTTSTFQRQHPTSVTTARFDSIVSPETIVTKG